MKVPNWVVLVCLLLGIGISSATTPNGNISIRPLNGELRMLGATHTLISNDIEVFMRPIREHGFNAVMVHGLDDEWGATYPSKIFPFAVKRNFKPDTLEQIVRTCHQEQVKVIAYVPWIMFTDDPQYLDEDQQKRDVNSKRTSGAITSESDKGVTSFDSPFRHLLAGAIKEICALGVDGIWVDGFSMEDYNKPGVHFTHGAAVFKQETGLEWPEKVDWESETFRKWVAWRYEHHIANGKWLIDQVHTEYPDVTFSFNTHFATPMISDPDAGTPGGPLTWDRWRESLPLWRLPDELGSSSHSRLTPSNVAQSTPFWLSLQSDLNPIRSDLWQPTFAERFHVGVYWHAYGSPQMNISADELGIRMSALAAFTFKSQIWPEGNIRDSYGCNHEMYTRINNLIKEREAYFGGERVPWVGVYLSNKTRDFWALRKSNPSDPKNTNRLFTESYWGLVSMLMSDHHQFSNIFDNMIELDTLAQFPVIILPNVACLSEKDCQTLKAYVEGGGKLIATYETGLYDEWGERRSNFGLSQLLGVNYQETLNAIDREPPMWVRELADPNLGEGQRGFIWQTRRTVIDALPGTNILATESGYLSPGMDYREELKGEPVITSRQIGRGQAIYIVDDVSQGYYQAPFRSIKTILGGLINSTTATYLVHAPSQIISNGFWQNNRKRLVIHLLNLPPMSTRLFERSQRDVLDEIVPVHDISIQLDRHLKPIHAKTVPSDKELSIHEDTYLMTVPEVKEHEMVVIDLE